MGQGHNYSVAYGLTVFVLVFDRRQPGEPFEYTPESLGIRIPDVIHHLVDIFSPGLQVLFCRFDLYEVVEHIPLPCWRSPF